MTLILTNVMETDYCSAIMEAVIEQDAAAVEARAHAPPDAPPLRLGHAVHGGSAATSGSWAPRA